MASTVANEFAAIGRQFEAIFRELPPITHVIQTWQKDSSPTTTLPIGPAVTPLLLDLPDPEIGQPRLFYKTFQALKAIQSPFDPDCAIRNQLEIPDREIRYDWQQDSERWHLRRDQIRRPEWDTLRQRFINLTERAGDRLLDAGESVRPEIRAVEPPSIRWLMFIHDCFEKARPFSFFRTPETVFTGIGPPEDGLAVLRISHFHPNSIKGLQFSAGGIAEVAQAWVAQERKKRKAHQEFWENVREVASDATGTLKSKLFGRNTRVPPRGWAEHDLPLIRDLPDAVRDPSRADEMVTMPLCLAITDVASACSMACARLAGGANGSPERQPAPTSPPEREENKASLDEETDRSAENGMPVVSSKGERKSDKKSQKKAPGWWLPSALVLVNENPEWSNTKIAGKIGVHSGTLSRSEVFKQAAKRAREPSREPPGGFRKNNKEYSSDVEGTAPATAKSDRGQKIPNSQFYREYCADCETPMRVPQQQVGKNPLCEDCKGA